MNTNTQPALRRGYADTGFDWREFQTIIDAMPDALVAVDERGSVVAFNREAQCMFGYASQALLGRCVETLLPASMSASHRMQREAFTGDPHARPMGAGRDLRARRADGVEIDVDISLSPLTVADAKIVLAAIRDVSERRRAQQEILTLNEQLEERVRLRTAELQLANERLEEFGYAVSHELRAPLRIVRGFVDLLSQDLRTGDRLQAVESLAHIAAAGRRMSEIVEGLMALARLDHHDVKPGLVDMASLVNAVIADLREEAPGLQVDFVVATLPDTRGDAVLLRQVFANLLSNAVKYCGNRRSVVVTVYGSVDAAGATYHVQDNGPGFNAVQAAGIFDPFKRLAESDPVEGLGIGLDLARRIVERHGGRIWADGVAGGGATFSFFLPGS